MESEEFDESELFATFDAVDGAQKNGISLKPSPRKKSVDASTELEVLKKENSQLKKVLRRIASTCQNNERPLASIVYFDPRHRDPASFEEVFIRYFDRNREERSDSHEAELHTNIDNNDTFPDQHSTFYESFALAFDKCSEKQKDQETLKYDQLGIPHGSIQYFNSYCLDSFGSSVVDFSAEERCNYDQIYFNILPSDGQGHGKTRRQKATCFNCEGDHKLQDCPKPRNLVRISAKRQEFMANFSSPFAQEARYHAEKNKQEKFKSLMPGKMTTQLREALGLSPNDLPPYIYRMRMLGYPPDWLPSNHDSGIVIHGKEDKSEERNEEEKSLDHEKYVQFPGFNVPLPKGIKDFSDEIFLPRMDLRHQLQLPRSPEPTSSRKHRPSSEDVDKNRDRKRRKRSSSDMDIDVNSDSDDKITPHSNDPRSPSLLPDVPHCSSTPLSADLEDGEIPESPSIPRFDKNSKGVPEDVSEVTRTWWFKEPMVSSGIKEDIEYVPPPFPLRPLPLHKISQILPGDMNHISFEDRNFWLDPVFGNVQIRTGRYDRLKTILACRDSKKNKC